jgi:hypothetical protein
MLTHQDPACLERPASAVASNGILKDNSLDRILVEIRSGRRLEKIANSIENYLHNQVARLEDALRQCRQAEQNEKVLQDILSNFELEKEKWKEQRNAEVRRLDLASQQLALGWQQLEDERRQWLDERNGR